MNKHNLSGHHAYTVCDYRDGWITSHNPTPEFRPGPLSVRDLKTLDASLAWASESVEDAPSYTPPDAQR